MLCVQCVRTYFYIDAVLVPQAAERETERQAGTLTTAARNTDVTDARALGPAIQRTTESAGASILWMRVLDSDGHVFAQGGQPQGTVKIPARWWEHVEAHASLGTVRATPSGNVFVELLPFRLPRPVHLAPNDFHPPMHPPDRPPNAHRPPAYIVEIAVPLTAVAGEFEGLRQNLIVGVIASIASLLSLAVIGLRAPHYLRGKYLENELQLAKRVQSDLQPQPRPISPHVEFGAIAVAADHIGGDFYDIFETPSGSIVIVLGDVSGKGVPAALLVSVLQGAIRSSTASQHQRACESINRMLCERTACERFATLFWAVFDPATNTLRYVNAGHAAPMLVRHGTNIIERLDEGGPVLGLLPGASYAAGTVRVHASDTLVLFSDGISEASDEHDAQFGEDQIAGFLANAADLNPAELCGRIMAAVNTFSKSGGPPDDRTLLAVQFVDACAAAESRTAGEQIVTAHA